MQKPRRVCFWGHFGRAGGCTGRPFMDPKATSQNRLQIVAKEMHNEAPNSGTLLGYRQRVFTKRRYEPAVIQREGDLQIEVSRD